MDPETFTRDAPGRLARTPSGALAFVPAPAPRHVSLSDEAVALLDEASNRVGMLAGVGRRLPNPQLLIRPSLRREAVLSSRIEGTRATLADLLAAEAEQRALVRSADVREVLNYVDAFAYGIERLETLPLSLRLIRELHERLMAGLPIGGPPGAFRTYQSFIGGTSEATARYVPPPLPELRELLDDFERFVHERTMRPLVQMAILHYQFEAIHPFGDGNGRVGRLLMGIFLHECGLMPQPLLHLSPYFERTRGSYYDGLMRVSTHGDWDGWIRYVLTAVRERADETVELAERLLELQGRYREILLQARASRTALALVETLFDNPLVTARRARELLGVSDPTARAAIAALERAGILTEITSRTWGRVFRADEVYLLVGA